MHAVSRQSGELPQPPSGWRGDAACRVREALTPISRIERHQMEQVKLYDTTLRDGMGGQGMSLSVGEKLKVVQRPRRARRPLHRGRLPQLQPEGGRAVRAARRAGAGAGDDRRLRDDPAPRRAAAEDDEALAVLVGSLRPRRLPGRQELEAAPGEGDQGLRRGEPGDDRRLDRLLPRARQAPGLRRRALLRRLPRRPGLRARMRARGRRGRRRERHPLRHQRRQPARLRRRGHRRRGRRRSAARSRSASTPTTTPSARSPTRSPRSTPAPAWCRAASTATASAAATPTSPRSCRRCS